MATMLPSASTTTIGAGRTSTTCPHRDRELVLEPRPIRLPSDRECDGAQSRAVRFIPTRLLCFLMCVSAKARLGQVCQIPLEGDHIAVNWPIRMARSGAEVPCLHADADSSDSPRDRPLAEHRKDRFLELKDAVEQIGDGPPVRIGDSYSL